ncbi:MAG: hypothetical protein JXO51_09270 [Candidatus Aminicenantes bacterium]|nr:hypothetical protein [Candidatus Aminicenantes bacterium]
MTGLAKCLFIGALFLGAVHLAGAGAIFFAQGLSLAYLGLIGAGRRRRPGKGSHGT